VKAATRVSVRLDAEDLDALDRWRAVQTVEPTRAASLRAFMLESLGYFERVEAAKAKESES